MDRPQNVRRLILTALTLAMGAASVPLTAGVSQAATNPSCISTPTDFAHAFLNALGDPVSSSNVSAIVAWEDAEGGNWHNTAEFNPLNTTLVLDGSHAINSAGVQSYSSWDVGVTATVDTINGSAYSGVRSALHAGNNANAVASAVAASPWGTPNFSGLIGQAYDPPAPPWQPSCGGTTKIDSWVPGSTCSSAGHQFCLWYAQGKGTGGAGWGSSGSVGTISGTFTIGGSSQAGYGQAVRNNAASMTNATSNCNVTVWVSPNYTGAFNWLSPDHGGNLTANLRNNEASISANNCT
jgi:Peptidase inhibitor family I36